MKSYLLSSAVYQGKTYENCTLLIDEQAMKAEIQWPKGLRKRITSIAAFEFSSGPQVTVAERTVQAQGVSMVAVDLAGAADIAQILNVRARTIIRNEVSKKLKDLMAEFLNQRANALEFLLRYRSDPRQTLFVLSGYYKGEGKEPQVEFMEQVRKDLSKVMKNLMPAIGEYEKNFGKPAAERVFAYIFAACKLQDAIVDGRPTNDAEGLMKELGVGGTAESVDSPTAVTAAVLQGAHNLLSTA